MRNRTNLLFRHMTCALSLVIPVLAAAQQRPNPISSAGAPSVTSSQLPPTSTQLIQQGKSLYRAVRLKEALDKFEEALRLEDSPAGQSNLRDEALGLAAVTAFRLNNQSLARKYFELRAALTDQKTSVKAFCYYRIALTYWREVHELVVRNGTIENDRLVVSRRTKDRAEIEQLIAGGLNSVDLTIRLVEAYPEAYNIRNLLYAESALVEPDPEKSNSLRLLSIEALNRSIELTEQAALAGKKTEVADFGQPTVRIAQFSRTPDEDALVIDPMSRLIEGGFPTRRSQPVFPPLRAPKTEAGSTTQPTSTIETPGTAAPSFLKVEVLISTAGEVAFASLVEGRTELGPAAILAARGWRFEPARLNGRPVQVSGVITFDTKPAKGR